MSPFRLGRPAPTAADLRVANAPEDYSVLGLSDEARPHKSAKPPAGQGARFAVVPLSGLPPRRGARSSGLELELRALLAAQPDQAVRLPASDRAHAVRIGKNLSKLARDRGIGCRYRACDSEAWVWLDEDLHPKRRVRRMTDGGPGC